MLDLLIRNCTLADGRNRLDIGIRDGRIVALEANLQADAGQTMDAGGQLVTAPFVDAHFHLDSTLSYGLPRVNQCCTLLESIAMWGEMKTALALEA